MAEEKPYGLIAELKGKPRKCHEFDVGPMLGLASGKVKVRVPTMAEQIRAAAGACEYVRKLVEQNSDAQKDPDLLDNAKSAFIAFEACRDAKDQEKMPAFMSPGVMLETLTADQIGVLVNLANEVRRAEGSQPKELSDEMIDKLVAMCAKHAGDAIPEAVLGSMNREYLTHVVVMLSLRLQKPAE